MTTDTLHNITLINADCMNILRTLPDKAFDLAIADPPYGINAPNMSMGTNKVRQGDGYPGVSTAQRLRKGRLNAGAWKLKNRTIQCMPIGWDNEKPTPEFFEQLFRVSKNQVIWGGNYFGLPPTRGIVCWDKRQPWENFSQWEMAWTSFDVPAKIYRFSNKGGANLEKKIHPTQKPVELYKWLLATFAKSGDKIIDTHLGSGSICIASDDLGFEMTGIELDPDYYEAAKKRIIRHQAQQKLF